MSGSNSSAPVSPVAPNATDPESPVSLTVHSLPAPALDEAVRRTASGRRKMLSVLAICAAPVIASYFAYFVVRPQARTNYAELITPTRALPADLPLTTLSGAPVVPKSLHGQWLVVVVGSGQCDAACEHLLVLQRQLRETLGREKDRVDKVWLLTDDEAPPPALLQAISPEGAPTTVLRTTASALAGWLTPAPGQRLEQHVYIVDPMGEWMMRAPPNPDPPKLKSDLDRLLRASASWDRAGREPGPP
jgi:hypothetical protein